MPPASSNLGPHPLPFLAALLGTRTLAPQEFAVNGRDALQVLLHPLVILYPLPHLFEFFARHHRASRSARRQGNREVPAGTVPFPSGTLTIGLAAGDIALQQRATQGLLRPGKIYGQPAAAILQGQGRELG